MADPDFDALYPEHARLTAIADKSQTIYDFLSWLEDNQNACLIQGDVGSEMYVWADSQQVKEWLAEFFEIDLDKIEAEKDAMLTALREANS